MALRAGESALDRVEEGHALEPAHGEQPPGRKLRHRLGNMHVFLGLEHDLEEAHMRRLARVIQFLAQPRGDLLVDLLGRDGAVVALVERS